MKKIKFFAMALAALAMVSCSKENDAVDPLMPESAAMITVKITGEGNQVAGNQVGSRAAGESGTEDTKVNNYVVFLFDKNGKIVGEPTVVKDITKAAVIKGTTAAKKIYVVANTGDLTENNPLKGVTNEDMLKEASGELILSELGDGVYNIATQTKTNLWMAGSENVGTFTPDIDATKPSIAEVTVPLSFIAAKIDVIVDDQRTNNEQGSGKISIEDKKVALLFAGQNGKFFADATAQADQSRFFSGIISTTNAIQADVLADAVTTPFTKGQTNVEYHFYTFGNDATTMPTILTIQSERTDDKGNKGDIYYPIQFTASDAANTIVPGQQYTVKLTLRGDVGGGGGGGTTDPEEEIKSAEISVTVEPASWLPVIDISKDFN